jgi:hypothetical protein
MARDNGHEEIYSLSMAYFFAQGRAHWPAELER